MTSDQMSGGVIETNDFTPSSVPIEDVKPAWNFVISWIAKTEGIPHNRDAFVERYGAFQDEEDLGQFLWALSITGALATVLGSPASLTKHIADYPDYVTGPQAPDELYAAIVWLAIQTENTAGTVTTTYDSLPILLDPAQGTIKQRADALKQVLVGEKGGLTRTIDQLTTDAADLRTRLDVVQEELVSCIATLTTATPLNEANRTIGALRAKIEALRKQPSTPEIERRIQECQAEIKKKESLARDLHDVYPTAHQVAPKLVEVSGVLRHLGDVLRSASGVIGMMCGLSSDEQLSTSSWVIKALDRAGTRAQWQQLQDKARTFVQHAQVTP